MNYTWGRDTMNEFTELFNAESYGEGGTEVAMEQVDSMESAVSYHMMDAAGDNGSPNLASLSAEMEPPQETTPAMTPTPVEATPQPPSAVPTETENPSEDALESFMASHSEDFRDVASMNLADYEQWLFQSEEEAGEIAVARIVSNFKASGYDVKPSYAAVAAATWSRMNYAGEEHMDALKKTERASVAELHPLVVEIESEGLTSLVDTLRRAETFTEDYRAEIISEIRAEMKAEQETMASEMETSRFEAIVKVKEYTTPLAVAGATLLGFVLMRRL